MVFACGAEDLLRLIIYTASFVGPLLSQDWTRDFHGTGLTSSIGFCSVFLYVIFF